MKKLNNQYHNILRWVEEGVSQKEIAKRLGVTRSTIKYHIKKLRREGKLPYSMDKTEEYQQIVKLVDEGMKQKDIAKKLNMTQSTVSRRIKKLKQNGWLTDSREEKHAEILELYYGKGISQKEIAKRLGIDVADVFYHIKKFESTKMVYENVGKDEPYSKESLAQMEKNIKKQGYSEQRSRFLALQYTKQGMYWEALKFLNSYSQAKDLTLQQKKSLEELKMIIVRLKDKAKNEKDAER